MNQNGSLQTTRWFAAVLMILLMLACLLPAQAEEPAGEASLDDLIALIGTHHAQEPEHTFSLNHLLGRSYCLKDSGAEISMIKGRMQELGYYVQDASYSDRFNDIMVERVCDFQANNGLVPTGIVDDETLRNLYAATPVKGKYYPKPYDEPELTMIIPADSQLHAREKADDVLSVSVDVRNVSYQKQIIGHYLSIYTVDSDGRKIQEKIFDTTGLISYGAGRRSVSVDLDHHSRIDKIYVGIKKVYYRDGSRTETIESPQYHCWEL